jgi:fimbrial chaperone protein
MKQNGNFSAYGRIKVFWRQNENSPESQIGLLQNVAVYPEVESRSATVLLSQREVPLGTLRILYEGAEEYAGQVWFNRSFQVGN